MKKLLLTYFEPFGGSDENASQAAAAILPDRIGDIEIIKSEIPVVFGKCAERAIDAAAANGADGVLSVGQAAGRRNITPELVAINYMDASIPDNDGNSPRGVRIDENGADAYFSTFPVRKMAAAINEVGVHAAVSYSAGAYVCNDVFYRLSHRFRGTNVRVGFIHVPDTKTLAPTDAARALEAAIKIAFC